MLKELDRIAEVGPWLCREPEIALVYDENVAWVAEAVVKGMPGQAGQDEGAVKLFPIEVSEGRKSMESALELSWRLLEADVSRQALLLAVGGGVTSDLAGFVASIYRRGIRFAILPTTLLAQVDAAIGGKTGVNFGGYKNELGTFHLPECTFLCPEPLRTLPEREWRCGMAEMLKTFLLADAEAYRQAIGLLSREKPSQTALKELVRRAADIKAGIVAEDPFEKGVRIKLNLGHSFAHALEAVVGADEMKHGEAVAVGIILAARTAERLGVAENGLSAQLEQDFKAVGLPVQSPVPPRELLEALRKDKKAAGGTIRLVLPVRCGEVCIRELPPEQLTTLLER